MRTRKSRSASPPDTLTRPSSVKSNQILLLLRWFAAAKARLAARIRRREGRARALTFAESLAAGAIAGVVNNLCTIPFDVVEAERRAASRRKREQKKWNSPSAALRRPLAPRRVPRRPRGHRAPHRGSARGRVAVARRGGIVRPRPRPRRELRRVRPTQARVFVARVLLLRRRIPRGGGARNALAPGVRRGVRPRRGGEGVRDRARDPRDARGRDRAGGGARTSREDRRFRDKCKRESRRDAASSSRRRDARG